MCVSVCVSVCECEREILCVFWREESESEKEIECVCFERLDVLC